MRDTELREQITKVCEANYRVYGARKIWCELNRQGHAVARSHRRTPDARTRHHRSGPR
ncbi:IS3 family transposase [Streptomyces sp. MBT53]|uniref:IS3 family transposase n=1 Tax=Streptomyces sp. MBT53 TaxID=1488384 RepID=UPI0019124EAC|nr:IS3 family transposase [Streptomyces sp. MBT53]